MRDSTLQKYITKGGIPIITRIRATGESVVAVHEMPKHLEVDLRSQGCTLNGVIEALGENLPIAELTVHALYISE